MISGVKPKKGWKQPGLHCNSEQSPELQRGEQPMRHRNVGDADSKNKTKQKNNQ